MKTSIIQTDEKDKLVTESIGIHEKLKKSKENSDEYIPWLEEMIFMISHKVRQPVAHILGISSLFKAVVNSPKEVKKLVGFMRRAALSLDKITRELYKSIYIKITEIKKLK